MMKNRSHGSITTLWESEGIYPGKSWDNLVSVLGSFFGECIRRRYGGEWRQTEGQWAIAFDDRNAIFPFAKMSKHFQGEDESILGLYRTIPLVFGEILKDEIPLGWRIGPNPRDEYSRDS